jgi:aldehyde:ferredoxin oxidoreductase
MLQPFPDGGSAGYVPDFEGMLFAYYQARGWDFETGKPSRSKLQQLGLGAVAQDLWDRQHR